MKAFLGGLILAGMAGAAGAQDSAAGSWGTAPEPATATEPGFEPEEQVATGRFLTALEVKPILSATQGSWVAVREYDGQDLLYFTQLLAWRCGLHQVRYAVNGGEERPLETEPCYPDTSAPNAIKADTILPYLAFPQGAIQSVRVHLLYDDGTDATAEFQRPAILMP